MQELFAMKWFLVRLCSYSGNSLLAANRELARDPEVLQAAELGAGIPDLVTTSDGEELSEGPGGRTRLSGLD